MAVVLRSNNHIISRLWLRPNPAQPCRAKNCVFRARSVAGKLKGPPTGATFSNDREREGRRILKPSDSKTIRPARRQNTVTICSLTKTADFAFD
jgi:hypothetical protein